MYVVVLTLTSIIKSVVTGQAPVTLKLTNTPGKKHRIIGGVRMSYTGCVRVLYGYFFAGQRKVTHTGALRMRERVATGVDSYIILYEYIRNVYFCEDDLGLVFLFFLVLCSSHP